MDAKGNDTLLKTTRVTEWTLNNGGYISLLFGGFVIAGCLAAYVIAVARGNVDPFLPLISDAAGSPPQNGLFGTLVCIGGMFGAVFMFLRYMIVMEKNREKSKVVTAVNKASLVVGLMSMIGITLITGYPINFYRNRDVWLSDVGVPHMIGGVMLFALGIVYVALQCVLTLFLKTKNKTTLLLRVALCLACTAAFVYHMITVPDNFGGISHLYFQNRTGDAVYNSSKLMNYPSTMGANLKLPIDTSGSYVSSAITEWLLVFFFCCFFFTFFNEAQQYSLLIVVETHHSARERDTQEESKAHLRKLPQGPQNGAQVEAKPASEVRKFLRRDSTCQTMTEAEEKVIIPRSVKEIANGAKKNANGAKKSANGTKLSKLSNIQENGSSKEATVKKVDQQTDGAQLQKDDRPMVVVQSEEIDHNVSTSCDDLGVDDIRNNIESKKETERTDCLVKDAEVLLEESSKTPFLEGNGKMKQADSDENMSSVCPLR